VGKEWTSTAERSALAQLRAFVPRRPMRYAEALRIAEHQAHWLLHLARAKEPPVATELITSLPRVEVVVADQALVSGSAHWSGRAWVIVLNGHERQPRQRFALAHELKHVIDHTTRSFLYTGMPGMTSAEQAERGADYFAGCLLVPRTWLRAACAHGNAEAPRIGRRFKVPVPVARLRLAQCGLVPVAERPRRPPPSAGIRCKRFQQRGPRT
jgi:Zn-dependent peptidase ImmA (M78 family)